MELTIGEWTSVKINIQRRSIALLTGGNTYNNNRISIGHMHSELKDTADLLEYEINAEASASIRNFVITCLTLSRDEGSSLVSNDFGADSNGQVGVLSELYRKVSLYDCHNNDKYENGYYKINTIRMTSLSGSSDPYLGMLRST